MSCWRADAAAGAQATNLVATDDLNSSGASTPPVRSFALQAAEPSSTDVSIVRRPKRAPQDSRRSCDPKSVILQRERSETPPRGREDRVQHGGRGHKDRGLPDTAPESARRHDDALDLRHFADAH